MEETHLDLNLSQFLRMVMTVLALVGGAWVIWQIRGTLLPFGLAFVLSYLLVPVVDYLESKRRISRYNYSTMQWPRQLVSRERFNQKKPPN